MSNDLNDPENYENEIAQAIVVLANAVNSVAFQLKYLGNGGASTDMGAIEALGAVLKEGLSEIAIAIPDRITIDQAPS